VCGFGPDANACGRGGRKSADLRIAKKLAFSRNEGYDFDIAVRVDASLLALPRRGKGRADGSYGEAFARTMGNSTGSEGRFAIRL